MNTQRRIEPRWRRVLLLAALLLAGCGTKNGSVTGTVHFSNVLLTQGTVSFYCDNGEILSSLISAEGTYRLPRVAPGSVRVAVVSHPRVPPALQVPRAPAAFAPPPTPGTNSARLLYTPLPLRYQRPESSGLAFVIQPGEQNLDLQLTP